MKFPLWLLINLFLFCQITGLEAQFYQGRVLDIETKEPLEFVQIGVLDKDVGVLSDESGNFRLNREKLLNRIVSRFPASGLDAMTN